MTTHTSTPLADKRYFCEGPRWRAGRFLVQRFLRPRGLLGRAGGDVRVELSLDDEQPSGLGWLPDGDLLVVG